MIEKYGQQSLFRLGPRQGMARKRGRPRATILALPGPRRPGGRKAPVAKGKPKKVLEPV